MGSLCQSSPTTSTSSYTPNPAAVNQYQDILNRANNVASTPYSPYGGQMVAGLSPTQQAGISNVNGAVGTAQPYLNTAAGYAASGAAPVGSVGQSDIERYLSPYNSNVINATMANINETNAQQQNQLKGNAASAHALGGDRLAVAQSELARQQGLASNQTLAGLQNQNYSQALGEANSQQANAQANAQRAGQAAFTFGNLGTTAQNAQLQGAQAQIGAGGLEQGTNQAQLNAAYQQYLQQQAFPYQQTGWLAGLSGPIAGGLGGTQTGVTQPPNASPFAQAAGLGLAGAGLFFKDGGSVGYADGGVPNFISDAGGYVPKVSIQMPQAIMPAKAPSATMGASPMDPFTKFLTGQHGKFSGMGTSPLSLGDWSAPSGPNMGNSGGTGGGLGGLYAHGGLVHAVRAIRHSLKRGYDDGGSVPMMPGHGGIFGGLPGWDPDEKPMGWEDMAPPQTETADLPREIAPPVEAGLPESASAYTAPNRPAMGTSPLPASPFGGMTAEEPAPQPQDKGSMIGRLFGQNGGLDRDDKRSLLAAGLGILGAPGGLSGLQAIGQGGLQGLQQAGLARKEAETRKQHEDTLKLQKMRMDQAAATLAQQAFEHARTFGETQRYHDILDNQRKDALDEKRTRTGYIRNADGTMTPIKGGPADPEQLAAVTRAKQTGALLPDDTADFLAERVLAGDAKALVGLGRGAQGAENITRVQTLAARKAAEKGLNASDVLAKVAEQSGLTAQQRTFGTQVARMAVNSTEAEGAIQQGLQVSDKVDRGKFVPLNKLLQAAESSISDPDLLEFRAANLAIINTYARAISPTGTPTVHDKEEAMKVVSEATSPEAYQRVMRRMLKEIDIAHKAPLKAKEEMERIRKSGREDTHADPLSDARSAIDKGAPRDAVIKRLRERGIDPAGL